MRQKLHVIQKSLREECGVVGVSGLEGAAQLAFLGLYALQHRGHPDDTIMEAA